MQSLPDSKIIMNKTFDQLTGIQFIPIARLNEIFEPTARWKAKK